MAIFTDFLKLLKKDPIADGQDTFNIETMLNENWDKIDEKVEENSTQIDKKIVVTETNIPVEERNKGSFYFIVTDQAPLPINGDIKVSPTMGLKIV